MAVSENDLVVGPITPAAGVTTISLDFYFEKASWLEVYKAGSETPLVLNTDYTVTGAGTSSGVVTLTTPANGTDAYSIYLAVPLERSSDMQLRGEFKSEPFNIEMDRIWQRLQYHNTLLGRTMRVSRTADDPMPYTPDPETVLGFDAVGATTLYPVNAAVTINLDPDDVVRRDNVAALIADTAMGYTAGASVQVSDGQYVLTTAEGRVYEVVSSDPDLTTDGGVMLRFLSFPTLFTRPSGEAGEVPLRVIKSATPLSYADASYNTPAIQVEWSDDTSAPAPGVARDGFIFRTNVTEDGDVTLNDTDSGGTSRNTWRGLNSVMNKSGDASAHCFTGSGELRAVGPTGYNEHGIFVGSVKNTGSIRGTIHGSEVLVADGTGKVIASGTAQDGTSTTMTLDASDAGATDEYKDLALMIRDGTGKGQHRRITAYNATTKVADVHSAWSVNPDATSVYEVVRAFDTYLVGHIARISRDFAGARKSVHFLASAEGSVRHSAILEAIDGATGWNYGIDLRAATFSSGHAMRNAPGQRIAWIDGDANTSLVWTSGTNILSLDGHGGISLMAKGNQGLSLSPTSTNNPLSVRVNNTLKQVTEGAADSGGTGYKVLLVPN